MRKMLMVLLMLLAMSTSCYATNWEWIHSNAQVGYFFDKDSVVFEISPDRKIVNKDKVYVWVKTVFDKTYAQKQFQRDDVEYCINHFGFDMLNNEVCEKHILYYDYDKNVIYEKKNASSWQKIVPDSLADHLKEYFEKYIHANTTEIEQRTRGN